MAAGIQGATNFFCVILLKRERVFPDWPNLDHLLISEPIIAGGDEIEGLAKTS